MQTLIDFFGANGLMPHGYCLTWRSGLLWLNVLSDAFIVIAYYSIPLTLLYFVRKRADVPYPWIFTLFGLYIVACGTTHLLAIITIWLPLYWLDGIVKAITAMVSTAAAVMMYWVLPRALKLQSPALLEAEVREREKAQMALQESLDRLNKIASQVPGVVFQFRLRADGSSCVPYASEGLRDIYRLSPEEVKEDASKVFAHIHPDDLEKHLASIHTSARDLSPWEQEFRLQFADESPRWFLGSAIPQKEGDGSVLWHGFISDITARKQVEIDMRIAATAFESLDGMMVTDSNCRILRVNRAFTLITGYSAEEVIGQTPSLLKSDRQDADFYVAMWDKLNNMGSWDGEIWNRHKNGNVYPERLMITSVKDATNSVTNYVATFTDISLRKAADDKVTQMAYYDPLTGLANRRLMTDRLSQLLAHARRAGDLVIICMLDLDGFKQVNDQLGHEAGDALLIEVAKRLQDCVRQSDIVSRFGGDEFSLILCDVKVISESEHSFKRIVASLAAPYQINGNIVHVTASIGATIFPNDGDTPDLLLRHADQAMYEAKEAGKNCYCLFNPSHHKQQISNKAMLDKIGKALGDGEFTLYYQPQVDCRMGRVVGVEALIRWNHPILGLLAPSEFIPLLEHDNLIINVGEWVIHEALRQQVEWTKAGFDLDISVNVASRQLHQETFVAQLTAMLVGQDPDAIKRLTIEIVETAALEDITRVSEAIKQCHELGVKFAIDDFGTGFSSLAHLKHLPVNELKIDKSFVYSMLQNPEDLAIVSGVIGLGTSFKHVVVAEGVESIDEILMLMDLGCNIMQGYQIARPMPAAQLTSWLKAFEPDPLWKLPFVQAPSRDYFELLLAETNHRHWLNGQLEMQGFNPRQFLDSQQCRFGDWLYGDGTRRFGKESWFLALQAIHQGIHDSAVKLFEYQRDGDLLKETAEASYLQEQHILLNDSLKNARMVLSDQYLMANLNKSR